MPSICIIIKKITQNKPYRQENQRAYPNPYYFFQTYCRYSGVITQEIEIYFIRFFHQAIVRDHLDRLVVAFHLLMPIISTRLLKIL